MPLKNPDQRKEYEKARYKTLERREKKKEYDNRYQSKLEYKEYQAKWYRKNKKQANIKSREWYNKNKETELVKRWTRSIFRKFSLTVEQYYEMEKAQNYKCACCGTDKPGIKTKRWHIDHCHDTGIIRGLLCHGCNLGIGHFKDNPEELQKAISYLIGFNKYAGNTQWL